MFGHRGVVPALILGLALPLAQAACAQEPSDARPPAQAPEPAPASAATEAEIRVLPVDEAARHPGFFAFRARLQRAIAERDTAALLAVVDPEIKVSLGLESGIEGFRRMWHPSDPESEIWSALGAALALGGRFTGDSTFVAPYTFTDFPDDHDAIESLLAIADDVPARAAPDRDAEIRARLSFDLVGWEPDPAHDLPEGWTAIRLQDGSAAYARSAQIRSPIDFRAFFRLRDGRWRLVLFLAGD